MTKPITYTYMWPKILSSLTLMCMSEKFKQALGSVHHRLSFQAQRLPQWISPSKKEVPMQRKVLGSDLRVVWFKSTGVYNYSFPKLRVNSKCPRVSLAVQLVGKRWGVTK